MALRQDERALLQLVCERGQTYADLAELLGSSEDEVRGKARQALTGLGGADPDAEVGLTDYLLGQADPIGRADAVRYLQQDQATRELATTITTKLEAMFPGAQLPSIPEPRGSRRRAAAPSPTEAASEQAARDASDGGRTPTPPGPRSPRQARIIAGLGAAAVILIFAVLGIAGVFSGDDGGETAASEPAEEAEITTVALDAVGGSGVAGEVSFGLANETTLYADLRLQGLDPEIADDSLYLMWLMLSDGAGYPIPRPITPDANGSYQDRIAIAAPIAQVVAGSAQGVRISESQNQPLRQAIREASSGENQNIVVPFTGDSLAQGAIPLLDSPQDLGAGRGQGQGDAGDQGGGDNAGGGGSGG